MTAYEKMVQFQMSMRATGIALAPTFIAEPTNNLPAWFGPLVPADFWAFDSMRRVPMAQTMPLEQSKH
jgi:hypothetical protein